MTNLEKFVLIFFLSLLAYLLYRENHNLYTEKVTFYNCFDSSTQTKLFPMTKIEYDVLRKHTIPKTLSCTEAKYTRYYVKLLKGPYRK
tara:strand:+ start:879 stop:1142 length:264 start_codon:yes stop_codon:yes gene_type:complete